MKHIVITENLSSADIRPPGSHSRLRTQSIEDSSRFFGDSDSLQKVDCPACGAKDAPVAFERHGFKYRLCKNCDSLYVSPRPTDDALRRYYEESTAGKLRVEYFTEASADARMQHVIRSRVDWIAPFLSNMKVTDPIFMDVGTIYPHLFSEMRRMEFFESFHAADSAGQVAELVAAEDLTASWPDSETVMAATAFEQLEHQSSPADFLREIRDRLATGGILFLTTRTVSGFDLQVLWDETPYIFVPEHLNLLSIKGLETLFTREGFELLELSTPGQLDVEFVREAAKNCDDLELPRVISTMLNRSDSKLSEDLQAFLQKHRLSSHVRVAARRRD